jgi:hypothetical protein
MRRELFEFAQTAWRALAVALVAAALGSACGGGVDSGGTGAPATSFSSGRISGFGSIIVNGVEFDETTATIVDDDGVIHPSSDLALGMTVDVAAGAISTDASSDAHRATATHVQFGSAILGPVQSVDTANSMLTVLGQSVKVNTDTVFDGVSGGVAGVHVGNLLNVFAFLDPASGLYTATRIELKASANEFKLRGVVSRLDTKAKTFSIGGADISYAGVATRDLPTLVNGSIARVDLATAQQGGLWILSHGLAVTPAIADGTDAELEGFVAEFASVASFKVDGTPVDASGDAVVFEGGTSSDLANGVRVEVDGTMKGGVLQAQKVEFKKAGSSGKQETVELKGSIGSVNAAQQSFVLRGSTVIFDANTVFDQGAAADLVAGAKVEVEGVVSDNGTRVLATRISFDKK